MERKGQNQLQKENNGRLNTNPRNPTSTPTIGPGIKYPTAPETKSPVIRGKKIGKSLGLLQPFPGAVALPWKDLWEERHHRWWKTPVLSVGLPSAPFEYKFQKLAGTRIIFSLVPLSPTHLRRQKGTVKKMQKSSGVTPALPCERCRLWASS